MKRLINQLIPADLGSMSIGHNDSDRRLLDGKAHPLAEKVTDGDQEVSYISPTPVSSRLLCAYTALTR